MKKLSFLELEKEMEILSQEQAERTKGGGPPRDCAFHSMYSILHSQYAFSNISEQGVESAYNDFRNSDPCYAGSDKNWADEKGLQNINIPTKGLLFINSFLIENCTRNGMSISASYIEEKNLNLPNTTGYVGDSYMLIVDAPNNSDDPPHAVTFSKIGNSSDGQHQGDYYVWDRQREGHYWYDPDKIVGAVKFHKEPTTTMPTTTIPTTTWPTTTGV